MGVVRFIALLALIALDPASLFAADGAAVYSGNGGSGSAQFFPFPTTMCRYRSTMRIGRLKVALNGTAIAFAQLSATMTETNDGCPTPPLGMKIERYRLKRASFDGHRLNLDFESAPDNAAKNDVSYSGTLAGNAITGIAEFRRYDGSPPCNWTVRVPQTLTLRSS